MEDCGFVKSDLGNLEPPEDLQWSERQNLGGFAFRRTSPPLRHRHLHSNIDGYQINPSIPPHPQNRPHTRKININPYTRDTTHNVHHHPRPHPHPLHLPPHDPRTPHPTTPNHLLPHYHHLLHRASKTHTSLLPLETTTTHSSTTIYA